MLVYKKRSVQIAVNQKNNEISWEELFVRKGKNVLIVILILIAISNTAFASRFELRNGLTWYMSKSKVEQCIKTEPNYENYEIYDETDEDIKEVICQTFPQERTNQKMWYILVNNISLGGANEDVRMYLSGTKPHGLYAVGYGINLKNNNEEAWYNRAKDLTTQLSKKYGQFKEEDAWKKRKSKKSGDKVYESWYTLDEGTYILLLLVKAEDNEYSLTLEYQSDKAKEIEQSIMDGTIYIDPVFGL